VDDSLIQVGVGGIFAILIIREVLGFLKTRTIKEPGQVFNNNDRSILKNIYDMIREMKKDIECQRDIEDERRSRKK